MSTISLEKAQASLPELIGNLAHGEEIFITDGERTVAKLVGQPLDEARPIFGRGKGKVVIVSDDDDHLADFAECMP